MNLAVFDLFMATEMPFFIANSFYQRMRGHSIGCILYASAGAISGIGSAMTNACIAYDRYRCVSSPMDRLTKGNVLVLCLFTWIWAVPPTFIPALEIYSRFIPEGFLTTCSFDYLTVNESTQMFNVVLFVWAYVIPVFLIVISYIRLYGHVAAHQKMLADQAKKMNVASLQANKGTDSESIEIRIAKAAMVVFFLFLLSWTPYALVTLIGEFGDQ
jgi:r-opsin